MDIREYRLIESDPHVLAVARPTARDCIHGNAHVIAFKGMHPNTVSEFMKKAQNAAPPMPEGAKAGFFASQNRSTNPVHVDTSLTPFPVSEEFRLEGQEAIEAIAKIARHKKTIRDLATEMNPNFASKAEQAHR